MADLVGRRLLDRYFLREHVGSGGMADVFAAWDNLRSVNLAVKVLRRDLVNRRRFFQMFAQEAELLRTLEHPNIVRLYEFEQDGDIVFIVMDWVEGTNLRQAIADHKSPYSFEETSYVLQPVTSALHYAHQNNVFHCDVKPANILLHNDGRVLLTDFGVARLAAEEGGGGTPPYMAPEQFLGERIDQRTDVYALGVTLFELLTGGELPFRGTNPDSIGTTTKERIRWEHLNAPIPSPRLYNRGIPVSVESVVLTAMAKRAEDRFPTAQDLRESFERARPAGGQARPSRPQRDRQDGAVERTVIIPRVRLPKINVRFAPPPLPRVRPPSAVKPATAGVRMGEPHLVGRSGEVANYGFPVLEGGLTIGRSAQNQVRIRDRTVSRLHARIIRTRRGVYVRDENSAAGTYVNGVRITGPTQLKHHDIIRIGYYSEFEYREK